jgi:hypothetical protein
MLKSDISEVTGQAIEAGGELWYDIQRVDRMKPFLMTLASDSDHWLFLLSNGGLTAGRINPDNALLPYYTQDKLNDMSGTSGSTTLLRIGGGDARIWAPFSESADWDDNLHRSVRKNLLGNHIILEEVNLAEKLVVRISWRPSERFGFVRKTEIINQGEEAVELEVLDGLRNLMPPGLEQRFQNEFSILGDAYKQTEIVAPENIGVYHLSSVPTDLAEPMEALRCSVAWQVGRSGVTHMVTDAQLTEFRRSGTVEAEPHSRGKRGSYLTAGSVKLAPGESQAWYTCADVNQDSPSVEQLRALLGSGEDLVALIEADCDASSEGMRAMLASADGLQESALTRRSMRHTSNTLFNLMRGGAFPTGYELPVDDVVETVRHFNKEAAAKLEAILGEEESLTCYAPWDETHAVAQSGQDGLRLLREYLPLSFSRRHGDPSRPWNRFSIEIKEADGSPRFYYQGNWRDIFQNWEALLHSYPEYAEATICRFLNASTADGYNPYRLTKDGFDWEIIEPSDPWANIGYWGDHQIVYLLRLLETSIKFNPGRLNRLLREETFVYAEVPYRIRSFQEIIKNPRETVDYDTEAEARIEGRIKAIGADGKLMHTRDGAMVHISLLEKLLNPLLAKLSNFIPGGGIWMNTQRPEWNDANNALVGYGISVVTLGYVARYLKFMIEEFGAELESGSFKVSQEIAGLIEAQLEVFSGSEVVASPEERMAVMERLGEPASRFRQSLYDNGLSGDKVDVDGSLILEFLRKALMHANASLLDNKREDGLWHSYNLVKPTNGSAEIGRLFVMLEGQVSILSSGLLDASTALGLIRSLRESALYRADQDSFVLYPDKSMPDFLDKNRIPLETARQIPLLAKMLDAGDRRLVSPLSGSEITFNGDFNNVNDVRKAVDAIRSDAALKDLADSDGEQVMELFEEIFNHHAFTGRSGTFFAYEGLGSIYWHMVSKLVLAVQENYLDLKGSCSAEESAELLDWYRKFRDGLGVEKNPAVYGAFPTDAYSHTPAHAGAQQPGMTGQVKEDVLIRLGELGVSLKGGEVSFRPDMLEDGEFAKETVTFNAIAVDGSGEALQIQPGSMAFTFCQVPVVYTAGTGSASIRIHGGNGDVQELDALTIPADLSRKIFRRTGEVKRIEVNFA